MLDPQSHSECLQFIRTPIAQNDPQTALDVASVVKEVCDCGHADRATIWAELSEAEQEQFRRMVAAQPASNRNR